MFFMRSRNQQIDSPSRRTERRLGARYPLAYRSLSASLAKGHEDRPTENGGRLAFAERRRPSSIQAGMAPASELSSASVAASSSSVSGRHLARCRASPVS
jgi:hypothetical protein